MAKKSEPVLTKITLKQPNVLVWRVGKGVPAGEWKNWLDYMNGKVAEKGSGIKAVKLGSTKNSWFYVTTSDAMEQIITDFPTYDFQFEQIEI